jgi:type VI secretion system protein ImpI
LHSERVSGELGFVGFGLSLQAAHRENLVAPFVRVFERCPVLVGRDELVANCVLPDSKVSRLHVSIDIRDGRIVVRDSGSTNGTFVGGQRIASDRWVVAGNLQAPCEIRIVDWLLTVTAREFATTAPLPDGSDFLTAYPPVQASTMMSGGAEPPRKAAGALDSERGTAILSSPVLQPAIKARRAFAAFETARAELIQTLAESLDSVSPQDQPQLVQEILKLCPGIEKDAPARSLLERHARAPLPPTLEQGSTLALQELARWYVNDLPPLASANDAFAFARKLKTGIDELLLGLVPLFAGLDRFEQQMALKPPKGAHMPADVAPSSRLPRVPRDAARRLFDWSDTTDDAVHAVRTDIVDLTMHQVAVLNGVMRGVKVLLSELAPEAIEQAFRKRVEQQGLLGRLSSLFGAAASKWRLYRERHSDLADEENERFRVIFGPEFAAEYKQSGEAGALRETAQDGMRLLSPAGHGVNPPTLPSAPPQPFGPSGIPQGPIHPQQPPDRRNRN